MTKKDLATRLATKLDLKVTEAEAVIDSVIDVTTDALTEGNSIYIRGFGSFMIYTTKQRTARNIARGTAVVVPPHRAVKFKPYAPLKEKILKWTE